MSKHIKTSHGIALLGACLILAVIVIGSADQGFNQGLNQLGQLSKFTSLVNPRSQLAQVGGSGPTVIFLTSGSTWTVPSDWNSSNNTIEVIGGGGGGSNTGNQVGGGGGGYSKATNVSLTPGGSVNIGIGIGGAQNTSGGNTWFNGTNASNASVSASGGSISGTGGTAIVGSG